MGDQIHGSDSGSPVSGGRQNVGRGRLEKIDRSRRCWSDREEAILVVALKDLVAHGWKSDNGFRAGYLTRIEECLKREFPTTDIKAEPHIKSKITAWKKYYYSLSTILARSGVGFNAHNDFKIECDDEQWAQIVQKDGNAKYMRNKSWPHWDSWNEVFGKERAGGGRARDIAEAVNKLPSVQRNEEENFTEFVGANYPMSFEELFPDEVLPEGMNHDFVQEAIPMSPMFPMFLMSPMSPMSLMSLMSQMCLLSPMYPTPPRKQVGNAKASTRWIN